MLKCFLITRPAHQSSELIKAIEKNGGTCIQFPCLEISKPSDQKTIEFALTHFNQFDLCIFTSTNAILPQFKNNLSTYERPLIAIGPATAKHMSIYTEKRIVTPNIYNSEGVLELPQLQSVDDLKIAIFTGENPKKLLKETLESKGANVTYIICYKRRCPHYTTDQINSIAQSNYAGIITTSKEIIHNLISLFKHHEEWLKNQPLIVISESMLATARAHGFKEIYLQPVELLGAF